MLSGLAGSVLASRPDKQGHQGATRSAAIAAYVHGVAGQVAAVDGPPTSADVLSAVRGALLAVSGAPHRH